MAAKPVSAFLSLKVNNLEIKSVKTVTNADKPYNRGVIVQLLSIKPLLLIAIACLGEWLPR